MTAFAGITGMITKHGGVPALIAEREMRDTPTMLRVSIEQGRVVEDHRVKRQEEGEIVNPRDLFIHLLVDEGLPQKEAAEKAGYASASGLVQRLVAEGALVRVAHGRYVRGGDRDKAQEPTRAPTPGLTEERVREIVRQAVLEAVKSLTDRLNSLEENYIATAEGMEELESETVPDLEANVQKLQELVHPVRDAIGDMSKRIAELQEDVGKQGNHLGAMQLNMTQLSAAVSAVESDVQELQASMGTTHSITLGPVAIRGEVDPEAMEQAVLDLVRHSGLGAIAEKCHELAVARGKYEGEHPIEKALKDLAGEVIELAVEHAIDVYTEEIGRQAGPTQHTRDEFGDVMANLLSLAVEMDIDPETALRDAMQRNAQRAREGV